MKARETGSVFLPVLLSCLYAFTVSYQGYSQASVVSVLIALGLALTSSVILVWILSFPLGGLRKAAVFLALASFPIVYFAHIRAIVAVFFPAFGRIRFLAPLAAVLLAVFAVLLSRSKRSLRTTVYYFTTLLIFLTVYSVGEQFLRSRQTPSSQLASERSFEKASVSFRGVALYYKPDIYYLVLDSYTSSSSLLEYWGYDNRLFEKMLQQREFYIANNAECFIASTLQSTVSTLDMSSDTRIAHESTTGLLSRIRQNLVFSYLRDHGYSIRNFSIFDLESSSKYYNFLIDSIPSSKCTIENVLFVLTQSYRESLPLIAVNAIFSTATGQLLMRAFEEIPSRDPRVHSPSCTYAHLMIPHLPDYFDRQGKAVSAWNRRNSSESFLEQLIWTNTLVTGCVDRILASYPPEQPPIIVIQGDHGFRYLRDAKNREKEKYTILNAYRLPGGANAFLYPGISPYNTFRLIFSAYFGEDLQPLPDLRSSRTEK